tara:strand:- start:1948 stop:3219 length:1272 start_codon:yes stop_codon:yes gene_type:complete
MKYIVLTKNLFFTLGLAMFSGLSAAAETTVDWLHIEAVPANVALMEAAAAEYETTHPGIVINMQFLENEAYKAKLTTLLQSDAAPDIFYSWGGGVLTSQQEAGVLRSIDGAVSEELKRKIGGAGVNAFTRDGMLYGLAEKVSQVGFWGNKKLLSQAGLVPADMATWEGFLSSVEKIKAAGITPIALGGQDKWPVHFYWSHLVVRLAGNEAFNAARLGEGDGFSSAPFVKAGEMFLDLVNLDPFQEGFLATDYGSAAGYFGDGKAALHLMGNWDYSSSKSNSESGKGISDDNLVFINFPVVAGGAGRPSDTLGGINGWIFHRNAPDEAVAFMNWYESPEVQSRFAEKAVYIPIVAGGSSRLENPFFKTISENISSSQWHAIFFDQELGADVGGVVNDISLELSSGALSAQEAAELVKEAVEDSM